MSDDLTSVYQQILEEGRKKRDITSSTVDVLQKSHPKSPIVLDFESELFGLKPEDVKKLPIQSVEMLQNALTNLVSKTKDDPMLRQALRRFINNSFTALEKEDDDKKEGKKKVRKESVEEGFKDFLEQLSEASKAQKFNWRRILDIDERKLNDLAFVSLLETFGLNESLTRPQKQGVMLFLKKLAELAESNTQIALALTKLVRFENQFAPEPQMEACDSDCKKQIKELKKELKACENEKEKAKIQKKIDKLEKCVCEEVEAEVATLLEGITDTDVSPSSILLTFGIGTADNVKKDALAEIIFAYDHKFMDANKDKKITWKTVEAAFTHNKEYLKKLLTYATKDPQQMKILAKKIADLTGKDQNKVEVGLKPNA